MTGETFSRLFTPLILRIAVRMSRNHFTDPPGYLGQDIAIMRTWAHSSPV